MFTDPTDAGSFSQSLHLFGSIGGISSPQTVPLGTVQLFSISAVTMQKMDSYNSYICIFINFSSTDSLWKANLPAVQCYIFFCIPLPSWDNEHIEANLFPQLVNKRQSALFSMRVRTHTHTYSRQAYVCDSYRTNVFVYGCTHTCVSMCKCAQDACVMRSPYESLALV